MEQLGEQMRLNGTNNGGGLLTHGLRLPNDRKLARVCNGQASALCAEGRYKSERVEANWPWETGVSAQLNARAAATGLGQTEHHISNARSDRSAHSLSPCSHHTFLY
jgi:hypothetical protein